MYVLRNMEVLSCSHCYSGKSVSISYSECVFSDFGEKHAMRMRYTVIRDLPISTIFSDFGEQHAMRMRYIVIRDLPISTIFLHIIS